MSEIKKDQKKIDFPHNYFRITMVAFLILLLAAFEKDIQVMIGCLIVQLLCAIFFVQEYRSQKIKDQKKK